jgi:hypothetical protein
MAAQPPVSLDSTRNHVVLAQPTTRIRPNIGSIDGDSQTFSGRYRETARFWPVVFVWLRRPPVELLADRKGVAPQVAVAI